MCLWIWSSEPPFRHSHTFVASSSGHGLRLSCLVLDFLACPMRLVVPTERAEGSNDGKASSSIQWRECLFLVCQIRGRPSEWLYSHASFVCVCACLRALSRSHVSGFYFKGLLTVGVYWHFDRTSLIRPADACLPWDTFGAFTRH